MNPKSIFVASVVFCALAFALLFWRVPEVHAAPAIITVDTTTDSNAAGYQVCSGAANDCSLRGAISKANGDLGNTYTIIVPTGTYTLTLMGAGENSNATGDLDINAGMTISSTDAAATIIQGGPGWDDRIFNIMPADNVHLIRLTIRNGNVTGGNGGGISVGGGTIATLTNLIVANNVVSGTILGSGYGGGVYSSGTVHFNASTAISNTATEDGGGIAGSSMSTVTVSGGNLMYNSATGVGGALYANSVVTISNSTLAGNSADSGGGIYQAAGTLTVQGSRINANTATGFCCGGIVVQVGGSFSMTNSSVRENTGTGGSGGFTNYGTAVVRDSVVRGNSGLGGGGVSNLGALTMTNVTISGNKSDQHAGGFYNGSATALLNNVTIADNIADYDNDAFGSGGGVYNNNGTVNLANTLIGKNSSKSGSEPDCWGTLTSQGYNLIQSVSGNCMISGTLTGVLTNTNPLLGPLANVGGSTAVHTLLAGSPAINAGNPGAADGVGAHCMPNDQRGEGRPIGGRCDIGAFEGTGAALYLPLIMK